MRGAEIAAAYDARAGEYVELFGSVEHTGADDRSAISEWSDSVSGILLDAGCGPGHWADCLTYEARTVVGLDASARFIESARERFPRVPFVRGSLTSLPFADASVGGLLSWYSIIHTPPDELRDVLMEYARVLKPSGALLLGFFEGPDAEAFDHAITTAYTWSLPGLAEKAGECGFAVARTCSSQERHKRPHGELWAVRTSSI